MGMLPLIAAIWPLVNIGTTTVNVTGDHIGTCVIASNLGMIDKKVFDQKNMDK